MSRDEMNTDLSGGKTLLTVVMSPSRVPRNWTGAGTHRVDNLNALLQKNARLRLL